MAFNNCLIVVWFNGYSNSTIKPCLPSRNFGRQAYIHFLFRPQRCFSASGGIAMTPHSVLKELTGLAIAALMAWKLMVTTATNNAAIPAAANTSQLIFIR